MGAQKRGFLLINIDLNGVDLLFEKGSLFVGVFSTVKAKPELDEMQC